MTRIVILGAGGHAKVVCDTLRLAGHEVLGFLDDNPALHGQRVLGLPVLGSTAQVLEVGAEAAIVGIGDNATRSAFFAQLRRLGMPLANAIHPRAVIAADVQLGQGLAIVANVVVNSGSRLGDNIILNTACTVDHDCVVADGVHIAPGAHLCGGVHVGERTLVAVGAVVTPYKQIGADTVIGAGSVVTKNIPARVVAVGMPARVIRRLAGSSG